MNQHMEFLRESTFDLNSMAAPPQKRHVSISDEFAVPFESFGWKSSVGS